MIFLQGNVTHMGQIALEEYFAQMCPFYSKFGQSVLENGRLSKLEYFTPVLFLESGTRTYNIWTPT